MKLLKDIDQVFDPFFTNGRANGGTGTGLSFGFGVVREHVGYEQG